jgi:ADP-ribose pyrophosphatase YjhB (NUDIX family)
MRAIPCGSMELGETFDDTAKRKLFEETGVRAARLKLMVVFSGEGMRYTYPDGDEVYNAICI